MYLLSGISGGRNGPMAQVWSKRPCLAVRSLRRTKEQPMHRHHLASTGFIARILALALLSSGLLLAAAPSTFATTAPALLPASTATPTAVTFTAQTVGVPSAPQPVTFTVGVTSAVKVTGCGLLG